MKPESSDETFLAETYRTLRRRRVGVGGLAAQRGAAWPVPGYGAMLEAVQTALPGARVIHHDVTGRQCSTRCRALDASRSCSSPASANCHGRR